MADAAVEFLLENLKQLLLYHVDLIKGTKDQVEKLERELRFFRAFLRDTSRKSRKHGGFQELVREIRDVVYEAEDIIDRFVTDAAVLKSQNRFRRVLNNPVSLLDTARKVEHISVRVREIYGDKNKLDLATVDAGDRDNDKPEAPVIREDNVVGFEDEASTLIGYLHEKTDELDVISVVGMPGLGKTTLAMKIFRDKAIQYEFPTRIWVYVSQEFTKKDIYLTILKKVINATTEDMHRKNDDELAQMVCEHLEKGKFLIVMDDVWTTQDWDKIQVALPKSNGAGKVLITSRHREVAQHANLQRTPHDLRFLNQEESWLLLQYEVFGKPDCPNELAVLGKDIAEQCGGLPLALVVIGGILVKKICTTDDMRAKRDAWQKVSNSVRAYLEEDQEGRMEKIIGLSYDKLPYDMKACFLYLGMFPEDFEIPVWALIRMWIAEGFIRRKEGLSLEETAENYLDELINRNLVRADKRRPDGRVKTCRIHDMLHDFCKREAGSETENFLQEIKVTSEGIDPPVTRVPNLRRICAHSNPVKFLSETPTGPRVRSFVSFTREETSLPLENSSAIPVAYKLLRVLDVQPIKFEKIPRDMFQLVHLRYVALSFNSSILPAHFAKLWNIETLIVNTSSSTLDIRAEIWKMSQLRHLKTNASANLLKVEESGKEGEKLQTLGTISPESCTEKVFERARNLKKLGIRGHLALLLGSKPVSFNNLVRLSSLEKLKLLNDVSGSPGLESRLHSLPSPYQFPPNLKSLTLSKTFLDWGQMYILGLLENLRVLKLKEKAFMGRVWEAKDGGFRSLEVLHIGRTNLAIWEASDHHYPSLRRLELHNCEELKEIPLGLANIRNFQMLDLFRSNHDAVACAYKIHDAKELNNKQQDIKDCNFNLSIFPPPLRI
ncbi:putative late blight resistance protein homolog R1B-16 [Andrographis paniculata]|uniref:putative late blight resistance protein homolog R1B-16 n=1 Tax=Andrographis paniculata TaxID=175694 RepID=UPI0021E84B5A|nr:putative late blight resistance protein homolog R1B-16 [Andrographis paniculata]